MKNCKCGRKIQDKEEMCFDCKQLYDAIAMFRDAKKRGLNEHR